MSTATLTAEQHDRLSRIAVHIGVPATHVEGFVQFVIASHLESGTAVTAVSVSECLIRWQGMWEEAQASLAADPVHGNPIVQAAAERLFARVNGN